MKRMRWVVSRALVPMIALAALAIGAGWLVQARAAQQQVIHDRFGQRSVSAADFIASYVGNSLRREPAGAPPDLGQIDTLPLNAFVDSTLSIPGDVYLIDADGTVIASRNDDNGAGRNLRDLNAPLADALQAHTKGEFARNGVATTMTSSPVAGTPWRIVIAAETDTLFKSVPINWAGWSLLGVLALAFVGLILLFRRLHLSNESLHRANATLDALTRIDPLTGLWNRRQLDLDLADAHHRQQRYGHAFALIACDVDHFKGLNDRNGHHFGDAVLTTIATALQKSVRPTDRVYRCGGEEFMILVDGQDARGATDAAERMRLAVGLLSLGDEKVTISSGVAASTPSEVPDDLVRRADDALYDAKANGRDCVVTAPNADRVFSNN